MIDVLAGLQRHPEVRRLGLTVDTGNPKFFIGTGSAPHTVETKESSCGCAGCYSAHAAIPLYAEVFEEENSLDKLEAFTSHFGADFYERPRNQETIDLVKVDNLSPERLRCGASTVVPLRAGELLAWRLEKTP